MECYEMMKQLHTDSTLAEHRVMSGSFPQVLHSMLSHLPVADVCRLSVVCREWDKLANENHLWKGLCRRDGINLEQISIDSLLPQRCYYKSFYQKYTETQASWLTGEGVTTFTKELLTPDREEFLGCCVAITNSYLLTRRAFNFKDHNIYVYSTENGEYSHQLTGLDSRPYDVHVSNDGTVTAVRAAQSPTVRVWEIGTGECVHSFHHPSPVNRIQIHEQMLVSVAFDDYSNSEALNGLFLWSLESGQLLHKLDSIYPFSLDVTSKHIAVHNVNYMQTQLWHVNTATLLFNWADLHFGHFDKILLDEANNALVCLTEGSFDWNNAASVTPNGRPFSEIKIWDTETGLHRATVTLPATDLCMDMVIHDAKVVVVIISTENNQPNHQNIALIDMISNETTLHSINGGPHCSGMDWSIAADVVDNRFVLITTREGQAVNLWDLKEEVFVRKVKMGPEKKKNKSRKKRRTQMRRKLKINTSFTEVKCVHSSEGSQKLTYFTYKYAN